jgi:hypothetical protein
MALLAQLLGTLAVTFLISRGFLWSTRAWSNRFGRPLAANAATWLVAAVLTAIGLRDVGVAAWFGSIALYALGCLIWLIFDLVRSGYRFGLPPAG